MFEFNIAAIAGFFNELIQVDLALRGGAFGSVVVWTFLAYLGLMLVIGLVAWRRTASVSDFFLGGRTLGAWPAALSAGASDMSGWLLLGLPGFAYASGVEALWLAVGLLLGTWLNWKLVASRLRRYSERAGDALTLPEYLANRVDDKSGLIQVVGALFVLLFFLFYTSSGLVAGGKLFETVFGLDYRIAVAVGAACIVAYTLVGGFLAVSWTDFVQGLLMATALLLVPIVAIGSIGGVGPTLDAMQLRNGALLSAFTNAEGESLGALAIVSLAAWGLGYFGQPHILARFQGIEGEEAVPRARRIAVTWSAFGLLGAVLVGFAGIGYVDASAGVALADPERIFMVLVEALFHPMVAGVLLAAILAAIMSTADSQLLVSSSALSEDLYRRFLRPDAGQAEVVRVARGAVLVLALVAVFLAMDPESTVLGLVAYAWAGFGAAFGPVVVLGLYWSGLTRLGTLAGMLVGGVTVVVWKQLDGGIFAVYEIVPGIVLATLAAVVVSLVGLAPSEKVLARHGELMGSD